MKILLINMLICFGLTWSLPGEGIIVFADGTGLKDAHPLKYLMIKNGQAGEAKPLTSQAGKDLRISPDGKYVTFHDKTNIYVCEIKENAEAHNLGEGTHPSWVIMDGRWYLFYSSRTGKIRFETGNSYLQEIDLENFNLVGDKKEILYNGKSSVMKGGMSIDGNFASTGYPDAVLAEAGGTNVYKADGGQKCNVSIAPTQGKMLVLDDTGHETVAVYDFDGNRDGWKPGNKVQNPEWSTHPDWYTWVTGHHSGGHLMVGKIGEKGGEKVLENDVTFPHLWIAGSPMETVETPETPDLNIISPLEGASLKTGDIVTVEWEANTDIVDDVQLEVSLNGGDDWLILTKEFSVDTTMESWPTFTWEIEPILTDFDGNEYPLHGDEIYLRAIGYVATDALDVIKISIENSNSAINFAFQNRKNWKFRETSSGRMVQPPPGTLRLDWIGIDGKVLGFSKIKNDGEWVISPHGSASILKAHLAGSEKAYIPVP